ncbi:MAG: GGDEF domain-containing protein [Ruminococcus sp.]|nr:GGDEF domain-containing protein [Ruminococcus sp.]
MFKKYFLNILGFVVIMNIYTASCIYRIARIYSLKGTMYDIGEGLMIKRKRIAVIICNIFHPCQQKILKGLISQAHALNYDVAIFTMFMNFDEETGYQYGENHIFTLINYDLFDAVIYVPCSIEKHALRESIEHDLAEKCKAPVIALEYEHPDYHMVNVDDTAAFEQVVSHLIEKHQLTEILCLTGFEGNLQAEARLQGYRNAMENHGLSVREDYVIYGDFWINAANNLAEKLAAGKLEMPEAVVCVSDFVAITLCNRLIELGVRVPEDIIITGFDASKDAANNVPSITSYSRPLADMGMRAVLLANRLLTGEECEPIAIDNGLLVPAESCGCKEDFSLKFHKHQQEINTVTNYQDLFQTSHMAESLNSSTTLNQCLFKIVNNMYLIYGIQDFYLCLCDQWDDYEKGEANGDAYMDYTDTMRLRISCMDCNAKMVDQAFDRSELLPELFENSEIPRALYFTPLHFNERCLGYTAIGYGDNLITFDELYHSWIRYINNALEFVRIRNIFNSMHQRLYMASIRDTLTGIFNRKGFRRYSAEAFQRALETGKKLLIIAADLDNLKSINDNFGHLEGDNAISVFANALNTCFENDEICARTGGDEFFAIGCSDYTDEKIKQYLNYIEQYLDRYNKSSNKPYLVEASIGYICRTITEKDALQQLLDEADGYMYANKVARKKNRT